MGTEKEIMKYISGEAVDVWKTAKIPLDNWLKETSKKPKDSAIKKNKYANNANYLEIGYIEAQLDRLYHGLWSFELQDAKQMVNGVAVIGHLKVFHPVAAVWLTRSGVGFKEFQLKSGSTDPTPDNLSNKALERDIPIAAAEAFKNAAKKFGNAFGRHLNRDFQFDHVPNKDIIKDVFGEKENTEVVI